MNGIQPDWFTLVRSWASSEPLILKAYFFGSRAKGVYREDSDLDIAVEVDGAHDGEALANALIEIPDWQAALNNLLPVSVDLQRLGSGQDIVPPAVRDHGILVYERTKLAE